MHRQPHTKGRKDSASGSEVRARLLAGLPLTERRHDLAGIPTAVLEGGDGPPLVLLHGPGEFAAVWERVLGDLVATHRVIVPDLPGHGASGMPEGTLDRARVLSWLAALVERTCHEPPVLVGHLLGGAIATHFCVEQPGSAAGLVLVDSFGLARMRPTPRFTLAMLGFMMRPTERTQERLFSQCMVDLDGVRAEMDGRMALLEQYALERAKAPTLKAALRRLMPQFAMRPLPTEDLARLTVPTTLIWGHQDRQVRVAVAEKASARYGWPLHVVEGAADDPAVEQPAAFLRALHTALGATSSA